MEGTLLLLRPIVLGVILAIGRPAAVLRSTGDRIAASFLLLGTPAPFSLARWFGAVALIRRLRPGLEVFAAGETFSLCHVDSARRGDAWIQRHHHTMRCTYCCRWVASCVEQTLGRISQVSIKASYLQAAHRQVPQAKARRANGGSKPGTFDKPLQEVILTDSDRKTRAPSQTGLSPRPAVAGLRRGKTSFPYSTRRPSFHPATWRPAAVALAAAV